MLAYTFYGVLNELYVFLTWINLIVGLKVREQRTNLCLVVNDDHLPLPEFHLDSSTNCYFELSLEYAKLLNECIRKRL